MAFFRKIRRLFNNKSIVDVSTLREELSGRSRRSVFRDLSTIKHLASFTHSGKYLTLPSIPQFDSHGLWFVGDVGFSRHGTLKDTITRIIQEADAGHTQGELEKMFRVRSTHNTVLDLVKSKRISREVVRDRNVYVYLSRDQERARRQLQNRLSFYKSERLGKTVPPLLVVHVLAEVIRGFKLRVSASEICERLRKKEIEARQEQVEYVFARYGIGVKKGHLTFVKTIYARWNGKL